MTNIITPKEYEFSVEDIYTPLEEAKKEIWRRWNDKELQKKVDNLFGGDIPKFLRETPKTFLARHVATPNFGFLRFLDLSKKVGLDWVCPEYLQDTFVSKNPDKYFLGKLFVYEGLGKHEGEKISIKKIVNFNEMDGKPFCEVKTLQGMNFVDFHHRKLLESGVNYIGHVPDISDWLRRHGSSPSAFYPYLLSLFVRNAILFDNFLLKGPETDFVKRIFFPNLLAVEKEFDLKPLIVRLAPKDKEASDYWFYYPESVTIDI